MKLTNESRLCQLDAMAYGIKTMFENGLQKMLDGYTSREEVERVAFETG